MDALADLRAVTGVTTPAFVYAPDVITSRISRTRAALGASARLLFSVKALTVFDALKFIAPEVDGFSVSSFFEARIASEAGLARHTNQYISPLLRESECRPLTALCRRITLNSLGQLEGFGDEIGDRAQIGIRINPELSFVDDARFDPCRRGSKLGVKLTRFAEALRRDPAAFESVSGLHVHSNCDSVLPAQLLATLERVESVLGKDLQRFTWLNVGGGYDLDSNSALPRARAEFERFTSTYGLEIFFEPGAALVRDAGYFIASVRDIIESDDAPIAVLDLSVNHWPEVFEYQFRPEILEHIEGAPHRYLLAGCSCLAGDLFGEYSFAKPLQIGNRIIFPQAGAYSMVKAHMFNGINLPSIYALQSDGQAVLIKKFGYEEFLTHCGGHNGAPIRTRIRSGRAIRRRRRVRENLANG